MPELPEVETVRLGLQPAMEGARFDEVIANRPDLRTAFPPRFADRLEGQRVETLRRRAKYLVAELSSGEALVMHLGMSGSFRVERAGRARTPGEFHHERGAAARHDHVIFRMSSGATITFNDPRRFGSMALVPRGHLDLDPALAGLGPEPLDDRFDAAALAQALRGKKTTLKAALLDQRVVAGLGNIYVSEALHRAHLSPKRQASTLATPRGEPRGDAAQRLATAIKAVLREAIEAGGSSLRDHRQASGELGYFQHRFRVYDREDSRCRQPKCAGVIKRIVQGGRSTFFCPRCQR